MSCAGVAAFAADGGVWARQQSPTFAWLKSVHFLDARRGWAVGTNGTLLRTTDGGAKWELMPRPVEDTLLDVHFADESHGWLLCEPDFFTLKTRFAPRSYILRTVDGGNTWMRSNPTAREPALRLTRLLFTSDLTGWTFGETGALYQTTDGGESWIRQPLDTRLLILGGTFLNPTQGWLVGASGAVWHTADAGATWRESRVRALPAASAPGRIAQRGDAQGETSEQIARTGGASERLRAVSFVDARRGWSVGADGRVWATANGGVFWRRQTSGTEADLLDVAFLNPNGGWAVGAGGTIIETTNGGRTWTVEETHTAHRLESVCAVAGGHVWAVGFGGTILHREPEGAGVRPQLKPAR